MASCRRFLFKNIFLHPLRALILTVLALILIILVFTGDYTWQKRMKSSYLGENVDILESTSKTRRESETSSLQQTSKKSTFLFILILTSPKGTERRDAIRNTWLKNVKSNFIAKFIIGGKTLNKADQELVESENHIYQDIVVIPDLKDGYYELSNKVLQGFRWIDENIDCSFVMKADDDSFVRIDKIVSELQELPEMEASNLYWGFFRGNANVKRKGKWAEHKWVLCDHYLPYANGGGYLLSSKLVNFIARNRDLLQLYNSEDVSVGKYMNSLRIRRMKEFTIRASLLNSFKNRQLKNSSARRVCLNTPLFKRPLYPICVSICSFNVHS